MEKQQPDRNPNRPQPDGETPRPRMSSSTILILMVVAFVAILLFTNRTSSSVSDISYGFFLEQFEAGNVANATKEGRTLTGEFKKPPKDPDAKKGATKEEGNLKKKFFTHLTLAASESEKFDEQLIKKLGSKYSSTPPTDNTMMLMMFYMFITIGLIVVIWVMFRKTRDQMMGGGMFSGFSKSPAKRYEAVDEHTFKDVAGLQSAKEELEEIVEFLKSPEKFERLGGRVPKGVLLMGPPGTGKTLLGRAVAGEAGVPFFSISGSEFIQMFVGVGASRVRDMFATAKAAAPSILFIDEIDAVGRHRGAGLGGGHDEREQTLNQILSEMDGFTQSESVIVMAATNRPDVLDPALLRPGRFDRHVTVDRPNLKGRIAIFEVHSKKVPLADDVDFERLAAATVGLTGADIQNLVNEAALWATRKDKEKVEMVDFEHARDKVLMGSLREEVLIGKEKSMTAYHEAGHALLGWLAEGSDRVHKVTIIPRGRALGVTQLLPDEDRVNISESELHRRLDFILGGRAAEKLAFDEYSAGAENDLKQATELARRMVGQWGMSKRLGPVAFHASEGNPFLGKEMAEPRHFSEHTAQVIDEEIIRILHESAARAESTLRKNRDKLDAFAKGLEESETLQEDEIEALIGPPVYQKKATEI